MRVVTLVFALSLGLPAFAQDGGHVVEDRVEVHRDVGDLERLNTAVDAWKSAVLKADRTAEKAADADLEVWVRGELAESNHEVTEDRSELGASRREARGVGPGDEVDRVDDRDDLAAERADRARMYAIALELRDLQPAFAAGTATIAQYDTKRDLLNELVTLSKREIGRTQGEVYEDRVERGEVRKH